MFLLEASRKTEQKTSRVTSFVSSWRAYSKKMPLYSPIAVRGTDTLLAAQVLGLDNIPDLFSQFEIKKDHQKLFIRALKERELEARLAFNCGFCLPAIAWLWGFACQMLSREFLKKVEDTAFKSDKIKPLSLSAAALLTRIGEDRANGRPSALYTRNYAAYKKAMKFIELHDKLLKVNPSWATMPIPTASKWD